ncbi:peptidoglycan-binding protein [Bradyrhizobium sp. U87765 SZCCT0131]|uniref:serine protease n=1 Tax=unclassified Bradyrhizobium TaxID=2631580 RepID=UPI001BA955A9|nr:MULTISPECIES: serine protease [unclassified Bradyrhizobium]MBR1216695.1 peptidoglycan-binding protein [Bradyrhizobium sp. U87765 SZCCT0131]MBR1259549.1 peptidoglycan-binding protein [Bradyrhizobium sp. U87765 SZCCT0134]MBR1305690.1 peptidoglycan-binding protein [Bradyrhizobium sp. U87765 SZCCT0110]MBR1322057.1 peptidoglycan-binding protein [Bradyrhizobium sp. U87765 SZCCT0109]MBR1350665.1 peptidoglycan-binding protein [Bradyrhizobium sp. U87765 SZCCT0048]
MKPLIAATLMVALSGVAAIAQTPVRTLSVRPDGSTAPAQPVPPKPATAAPKPVDPAAVQATQERQAIQSDLAWVGVYNGAINGEPGERTAAAIRTFQKDNGGKPTGTLTPQERGALSAAAKALQDSVGWKIGLDPVNSIKLGLPTKLVPTQTTSPTGTKWASAQGQIQIETWRTRDTNLTIAAIAEREKKEPAGRRVDYSVVKPDFFVLSGLQGLKKFYVRGQIKGNEVRGLTILYDQATEGTMEPVVIAMSSAFAPFAGAAAAPPPPPPRKKVEYATGVVVSPDGAIVTDRNAIDACETVVVPPYGHAERVADDATRQLVLLRLYGASGLKAASLGGAVKSDVAVSGIADPQAQGGGAAATSMTARLVSDGGGVRLDPAPGLGFAGAAVTDADGKVVGLAQLRAPQVASTAPAPVQATLVPAEVVRQFLARHKVAPTAADSKPGDIKASLLRVICIRK